jgi:hypothetical protein
MNAKKEGLERIVKGVAKVVDDWGWKGGKPGEIDAFKYFDFTKRVNEPNFGGMTAEEVSSIDNQVKKQMTKLTGFEDLSDDEIDLIMDSLSVLQKYDVPRKYTGKLYKVLLKDQDNDFNEVNQIVEPAVKKLAPLMRELTDEQRETFLNLLPTWQGPLEDAATVAKKLYRKPTRPS